MDNKEFATYEYMAKTVPQAAITSTVDIFESFGWEATDTAPGLLGATVLSFKRNRKINDKSELNRLQRRAEDIAAGIERLEKSKTSSGSVFAYSFGIVAALILGGGMSLCLLQGSNVALLAVGIILGIVGFILAGVNYLAYRKIVDKKTAKVNPAIDAEREKLANLCEAAHSLTVGKTEAIK